MAREKGRRTSASILSAWRIAPSMTSPEAARTVRRYGRCWALNDRSHCANENPLALVDPKPQTPSTGASTPPLRPIRVEASLLIHACERMRAEEIALSLPQMRRQRFRPVTVVISHRRRKRRHRHARLHSRHDHIPQRALILRRDVAEVRIEQQVMQVGVGLVSVRDLLQKARTNDATRPEDLRDLPILQIPLVLFRRRAQLRKALCIRNNLAQEQRAPHGFHERVAVTIELRRRSRQSLARLNTLILQRRQHARKHGFRNQRQWRAKVECVLARPLARALLRRA